MTEPIGIEHSPTCFAIRNKLTGEYWTGSSFFDPTKNFRKAGFFISASKAFATYRQRLKYFERYGNTFHDHPKIQDVEAMEFILKQKEEIDG